MAKMTPMMEQYLAIKDQYKYCLVFFRLGDFYELFFEDALVASKELDITLTGRDCGMEERAPMCGVPFHSADGYIARLVEKGYKVAICEQVEDPKETKTIVKREVVRVVTKGTILDPNMLDETKNNYVMCIYEDKKGFGLSVADVTTGEFFVTEIPTAESKKIIDEIGKFSPSEIITSPSFQFASVVEDIFHLKTNPYTEWTFEHGTAYKRLTEHFHVFHLEGFGVEHYRQGICAAGALLAYLYETQKNALPHIINIKSISANSCMNLDLSSRRNLELTETIRDKSKRGSLLWVLDKTKTAMGARLLRKWLEAPLLQSIAIGERLDAVEEFKNDPLLREEIKELLHTVYDIDRIMSRIVYQTANARDLILLKNSIVHFPSLKLLLSNCQMPLLQRYFVSFDTLKEISALIHNSIQEEPPFSIREGGFMKEGYHPDLDQYRRAKTEGTTWLLALEEKEREQTGIKNLKIKYNKIFGYYFEVTNSYQHLVPERFLRRQTLANCERYSTEELKKIEEDILGADEKIVKLEYELFQQVREQIAQEIGRIQQSTETIATIDVLVSFAEVAEKYQYTKPQLNTDGMIDIKEGRHPVVERLMDTAFIPNDTYLDLGDHRLNIITGPNMAGKSTYMRQTALIVLMAQLGSFVPADFANIGIVDRIFTRVGASDDLATGQSTFMVEMSEVANILNNASKNSLLILDEIGRGTSTYDGLSIAWSVLEYIADAKKVGAKTLFATHYHELTELEGKVEGVKNYCVTVEEVGEEILFLRKIARGGAAESYGIHVAKIAGVPMEIIDRANQILDVLNTVDVTKKSFTNKSPEEVHYGKEKEKSKNNQKQKIIIHELLEIDVDSLTPREALRMLYELQTKTKELKL